MVSHGGQMLSNRVAGANIIRLAQNGRPSVLEEVPRGLAIKVEHCEDVSGGHTIAKPLDTKARVSLLDRWGGLSRVRDSHDTMLDTFEHASVRLVWVSDNFNF